jgi:hypothetical protein
MKLAISGMKKVLSLHTDVDGFINIDLLSHIRPHQYFSGVLSVLQ